MKKSFNNLTNTTKECTTGLHQNINKGLIEELFSTASDQNLNSEIFDQVSGEGLFTGPNSLMNLMDGEQFKEILNLMKDCLPSESSKNRIYDSLESVLEMLKNAKDSADPSKLLDTVKNKIGDLDLSQVFDKQFQHWADKGKKTLSIIAFVASAIYAYRNPKNTTLSIAAALGLYAIYANDLLSLESGMLSYVLNIFTKLSNKISETIWYKQQDTTTPVKPEAFEDSDIAAFSKNAVMFLFGFLKVREGDISLKALDSFVTNFTRKQMGMEMILERLLGLLSSVLNFFRNKFLGKESVLLKSSGIQAIDQYLHDNEKIYFEEVNSKLFKTRNNLLRLDAQILAGKGFLRESPKNQPGLFSLLQNELRQLKDIKKTFEVANLFSRGMRQEPVAVLFQGAPGVGKSIVMEQLNFAICSIVTTDEQFKAFKENPYEFTYTRFFTNDYWSGYRPTDIVAMWDEFMQVRDIATGGESEPIEFCHAVNSFEWDLHMDKVDEKGLVKFNSKFCLATTNRSEFDNIESMIDSEALKRRMDHRYIVVPAEAYRKESANSKDPWKMQFDFEKLPLAESFQDSSYGIQRYNQKPLRDFKPEYQEFWQVDRNGELTGEKIDFDTLVIHVISTYVSKTQQHDLNNQRLNTTTDYYRSLFKGSLAEPMVEFLGMEEVVGESGLFGSNDSEEFFDFDDVDVLDPVRDLQSTKGHRTQNDLFEELARNSPKFVRVGVEKVDGIVREVWDDSPMIKSFLERSAEHSYLEYDGTDLVKKAEILGITAGVDESISQLNEEDLPEEFQTNTKSYSIKSTYYWRKRMASRRAWIYDLFNDQSNYMDPHDYFRSEIERFELQYRVCIPYRVFIDWPWKFQCEYIRMLRIIEEFIHQLLTGSTATSAGQMFKCVFGSTVVDVMNRIIYKMLTAMAHAGIRMNPMLLYSDCYASFFGITWFWATNFTADSFYKYLVGDPLNNHLFGSVASYVMDTPEAINPYSPRRIFQVCWEKFYNFKDSVSGFFFSLVKDTPFEHSVRVISYLLQHKTFLMTVTAILAMPMIKKVCKYIGDMVYGERRMKEMEANIESAEWSPKDPKKSSKKLSTKLKRFKHEHQGKPELGKGYDENGFNLMQSKMKRQLISLWTWSPKRNDWVRCGFGLIVVGNVMLLPAHFLYSWVDQLERENLSEKESLVRIGYHTTKMGALEEEKSLFTTKMKMIQNSSSEHIDRRDMALVTLPEEFPPGADYRKYFARESDLNFTYPNNITFMFYCLKGPEGAEIYHGTATYHNDQQLSVTYNPETSYKVDRYFCYENITESGDCGLPFIVLNPKINQRKIFGIHIAGSTHKHTDYTSFSYSGVITQEELTREIEFMREGVTTPIEISEPIEEGVKRELEKLTVIDVEAEMKDVEMDAMGTRFSAAVTIPGPSKCENTELRKSRLYGEYIEPKTQPCHLRPFLFNGEYIDPMKLAMKKFCFPTFYVPENTLRRLKNDFQVWMNAEWRIVPVKKLYSFNECIHGIADDDVSNGIKSHTSAGYPMNMNGARNLKKEYFDSLEDPKKNEAIIFEIIELLDGYEQMYKNGIRPVWMYTDTLKDQRIEIMKALMGKNRLFAGIPFLLLIMWYKYYGSFLAFFKKNKIYNSTAVGVNHNSTEWTMLGKRLTSLAHPDEEAFGAGDYSHFDGSLQPIIMNVVLNIINEWYDDGEENQRIRSMLWREVTNSRHIQGNVIYEMFSSQASGGLITMPLNCMYNRMLFQLNWYDLVSMDYEDSFSQNVVVVYTGDDHLYSVAKPYRHLFNEQTLQYNMTKYGMVYTSELKDDVIRIGLRKLHDCEFEKRRFIWNATLRRFLAPLRLEVVLEIPQWTKKHDSNEIAVSNAIVALSELTLHGKEVYDTWSKPIIKLVKQKYPKVIINPKTPLEEEFHYRREKMLNSEYEFM